MILIYYTAVMVSIAIFGASFRRVREGLLVGLIFTTFSLGALPWHLIPIGGIALGTQLVFMLAAITYHLLFQKERVIITKYHFYIIIVAFILVLFLLFNPGTSIANGIEKTLNFIVKNVLPILTISLFAPFSKRDVRIIFYTILFGSIISTLDVFSTTDAIMSRTMDYPLVVSRRIGLGSSLLITTVLSSSFTRRKYLPIVLFIIFGTIIGMLFTGSRGPLAAVLAVALMNLFQIERSVMNITRSFFKRAIIVSIIALVLSLIIGNSFSEFRAVNRAIGYLTGSYGFTSRSDEQRLDFYTLAWRGFMDTNGLGVGTGGFEDLSAKHGYSSGVSYPHNIFLEFASEQGIIGLVIIIHIVFSSLTRTFRLLKDGNGDHFDKSLYLLWIFGFVNSLVSGSISSNMLWITLIFIWLPQRRPIHKTLSSRRGDH
jgi:O-antigen ligase